MNGMYLESLALELGLRREEDAFFFSRGRLLPRVE